MKLHRMHCAIALALSVTTCAYTSAVAQTPAPVSASKLVVQPGDDFFSYANGDWLRSTEIPADRSAWGAFQQMAETANARTVQLIEAAAANPKASASERKVADYYQGFMDEAAIETAGLAPLKPLLASIAAIGNKQQLAHLLGATLRADVDPLNNTNFHTENLFGLWIAKGLTDPARNYPYLLQGGLGMPDRAYYVTDDARMTDLRARYQQHIASMLALAGFDHAGDRAERVMALEMAIARTHASREESEVVVKANNRWPRAQFAKLAPGMDWTAFFDGAQLGRSASFMVWHPGAVKGAAALVASTDLATWKDFLAFHQINHFAPELPKAFVDERFAFHEQTMNGTPQQSLRWKRALASTNDALDDAVGQMYVARFFPAENKARVRTMVDNIITAFGKRLDRLEWMSASTRAQAHAKLKTLYVGVAYPDHWKSYAGLTIKRGDVLGNAMRAEAFHYAQELARLQQKPDNTEWASPAQVVNAFNLPLQNAINFPAAILQPPFFDPAASDAANYGAIGSIIGHEITHSFDDQGAQFDAQGRLRDWWTAADLANFKAAANRLVAQYSAYKPFPDLAVNGQLTLGENVADLGGVAAAYDAYHASLGPNPPADADRQFYLGFAHAWQSKLREPAARQRVLTDGHAPAQYRAAVVRNFDAWYQAFGVAPGQALYLAPEQRVRMW